MCGIIAVLRRPGRTDKGVHAIGQVISFDVPDGVSLEKLASSVNSQCGMRFFRVYRML